MLEENGEYVDVKALTPVQAWVRYGGPDAAPVTTDGPHPETSDLIAGWFLIDVESRERALEVAAYVSSEPGPGGEPATIAALHDDAASAEETDWPQILAWYDDLVALANDPVRQDPAAVLGRAVALGHVLGAAAGLRETDRLREVIGERHRWHAVRGHLHELAGDLPAAASAYAEAARRTTNVAERDHLVRQAARARAA